VNSLEKAAKEKIVLRLNLKMHLRMMWRIWMLDMASIMIAKIRGILTFPEICLARSLRW